MKFDDWVAKVKMMVGDDLADCSRELLAELYQAGMHPVSAFASIRDRRKVSMR